MLNISKAMTAGAVRDYFQESGHDYYLDGRNPPGRWGGRLAREFGLVGEVQKEQFDRMAEGYHPITGEDLVLRRTDNRRSANDITISAPKAFSLIYLGEKDEEKRRKLLQAFVESCDWIMDKMEPDVGARVRIDGADHDRKTGNWAYAGFVQFDSRPDDNTELPCIQVHRHHTVFNLTRDPEEQRIKALQIGMVKENADLWMPLFHNELARRVRELGYGVERDPKTGIVGFGIAGVTRELVDRFSPRRATIQEAKDRIAELLKVDDPEETARLAKKLGITDEQRIELLHQARQRGLEAVLQAEGAKLTRKHKQKDLDAAALWDTWQRMLSPEDRATLEGAKGQQGWVTTDADAARYLIEHVFHRQSVVAEKKLLAEGLRYGVGSVTLDGLKKELIRQGVVFENGEATTRELGRQEAAMRNFAREGRGRWRPVVAERGEIARLVREAEREADIELSGEQAKAIAGLVGSRDAVNMVDAGQGTGKTTMLETYGGILARQDVRSTWLGTTHTAVDELTERGLPAMTVARFLASEEEQQKAAGSRIIVDESSMLAHADAYRLMMYAKENGCRVDFVGDSRQYKAPVAGNPMRLLKLAGVEPITMTKTMRQQGRLKDAMERIRDGQALDGHDILSELGMVHELPLADLAQKAADLYLQWSAKGEQVPVVSPTHAQAAEIAAKIREGLRARGDLKGEDQPVRRLVNLNWTPAQVKDVRKHGVEPGVVLLRYGAYREETQHLAVGDLVKTTMGGKAKDGKKLRAGKKFRITGFTKGGDPILDGGVVVDKNWGGLVQRYVGTGQGAQGITATRGIVVYGTPSLVATREEGWYVPVSRVRKEVAVLTDSNEELRKAIQRQDKDKAKSATELLEAAAQRRKAEFRQWLGRHFAYQRRLAAFAQAHEAARRAPERKRQQENEYVR